MHAPQPTRVAAAIAILAFAAATHAHAQSQDTNTGSAPATAADAEALHKNRQSPPGQLLTDPRNQLRDAPTDLPPGMPEGPLPVFVPELFMMALPRTEVSGVMPLGAGMPDMKYANTRVLPPPVFGTLGPADVLRGFDELLGSPPLPNGFNYHGGELNAMGGSYGRAQTLVQLGHQAGDLAFFGAFGGLRDDGWQNYSPARSLQYHGDVGYRTGGHEFHLMAHYLANNIKGGMVTPVELIEADRGAQAAHPVNNDIKNLKVDLTGKLALNEGWTAHSGLSVGRFVGKQEFTLESEEQIGACPGDATLLCGKTFGTPYLDINGQQFSNVLNGTTGRYWAFNDHMETRTNAFGGKVSLANRGLLWGRPNHFVAGVTYNGGKSTGGYRHYVGTLDASGALDSILGEANDFPGGVPQNVQAKVSYTGVHATDVLDVTPLLKVALAGRFTRSRIEQKDLMGTSPTLNETRVFNNFAPSLGATYTLTPGLLAYGGYRQTPRVVTPFGMNCEDAESVCNVETPWFAGDHILEQSVVQNFQLGLRGQLPRLSIASMPFQAAWNAGLYRTDTSHYYYLAPSSGRPEANDIGNVRAQGGKLGMEILAGKLTTSVNYTYTDARFRSPVVLASGNNIEAVNHQLYVTPGKVIPGQPKHTLRIVAKYAVTDDWSVGTSLRAVSSSYYFADEVNAMGKVSGYFVASFNANYRVNERLELFGIIENAFNRRYATLGALVPTTHNTSDPHGWMLGQPFSLYGGLRLKF